ncbi:MAG: DUF3570 domain-containing protein [Gammaproteobacteria bacterium]
MAVTERPQQRHRGVMRTLLPGLALACIAATPDAGVLPEDRADALYHSYDGGGVEVTGPSYLVRKGDRKNVSGSVNYYVDSISSASIDVLTQGSPYSEQRTQWSGNVDYLHADTTMTAGYTNSDESDYKADTYNFSISQSLFGDLTTVTIGYSRGDDKVLSNVDADFRENANHQNYHVSLSQVLTKDLLLSLNYDAITDEGYLQNPYRHVLVLNDPNDPSAGANFNTPETYPDTRTSNAVSANLLYYLPYRAALKLSYRYYDDDWDVTANTAEITYTQPLRERWIFDLGFRYYQQSHADFYADLFQRPDQQNFMARDKELSEFRDYSVGFGVSYNLLDQGWGYIDKATLNFRYNHIWFDYEDFSDVRNGAVPPDAPGYDFDADVIQLFGSIWY